MKLAWRSGILAYIRIMNLHNPSGWSLFIDPFHVCGNAAKLEDKTNDIFASVKKSYCSVLQIGCIPTDVKGVY